MGGGTPTIAAMRALMLPTALLLALAGSPALAQPSPQNTSQNPAIPASDQGDKLLKQEQSAEGRHHQRVQRIVVEDAGSRVDELRVGGQTQSITVQPKTATALPAYEVRSHDGARARPGNLDAGDTMTAPRVWNLGRF